MSILAQVNGIGTDRLGYVFEKLLAKISKIDRDLATDLFVSR